MRAGDSGVLRNALAAPVDGHPAVGEPVAILFRNAGAPASVLAVDHVTLTLKR